jgi:murein DD-endopeptidase MepM/ murein hydrolase activator NlpD
MYRFIASLTIVILLFSISAPASRAIAQSETTNPIYIVQSGDTLSSIAQKFSVPTSLLIKANNITDPNALDVGQRLVIPGLEGVTGLLQTTAVPIGSSLEDLALKYQLPVALLTRLNRITSPAEVFTGANLIVPVKDTGLTYYPVGSLDTGQSLLEKAIQQGANPWTLLLTNQLAETSAVPPGQTLFLASSEPDVQKGSISPYIKSLDISPLPLVQGDTITIHVRTTQPLELSGTLVDKTLHFFPNGDNDYVALQGIYTFASPGLAGFHLSAKNSQGQVVYQVDDSLLLRAGVFPVDPPLTVDPKTIDPAFTKPEDDAVATTTTPATATRLWTKKFRPPVDEPICIKSGYGNRRSYNGSPYTYFHTGLDYGVCANLNIYAPADGVVVFAQQLTVRGNAVIIDHGWGVYTGYWHQANLKVKVGDHVTAGQIIGQIGGTGRVTGPHLHWEVWVNGIQVEPLDWLQNTYP